MNSSFIFIFLVYYSLSYSHNSSIETLQLKRNAADGVSLNKINLTQIINKYTKSLIIYAQSYFIHVN